MHIQVGKDLEISNLYHVIPEIKFEVITKNGIFSVFYRHSLEVKYLQGITLHSLFVPL